MEIFKGAEILQIYLKNVFNEILESDKSILKKNDCKTQNNLK